MSETPSPAPSTGSSDAPAWAREEAFPTHAQESAYGSVSFKEKTPTPCTSLEKLAEEAQSKGLEFVWTPESDRYQVPEEIPQLWPAIRKRRLKLAQEDRNDAQSKMTWGGLILGFIAYRDFKQGFMPWDSMTMGIGMVFFFIFALMPWYESIKAARLARREGDDIRLQEIDEARFESWLSRQKIFGTFLILALIIACYLVQVSSTMSVTGKGILGAIFDVQGSASKAALIKPLPAGEAWRLFTAPFLHGNLIHLLMNAGGLLYLGRRTEVLARWPHLITAFFVSILIGGFFTLNFTEKMSVGASGGLMGLLGFLLVFESLHKSLVPKPARRRLCAALFTTFVMGFFGYQFIDNYAHLGGLLGGMLYAWRVFPKSSSPQRPKTTKYEFWLASVLSLLLIAFALFTCLKLLA